jgi:hypothetical protein
MRYLPYKVEYLLGLPLDLYTDEQGDTLTDLALRHAIYIADEAPPIYLRRDQGKRANINR